MRHFNRLPRRIQKRQLSRFYLDLRRFHKRGLGWHYMFSHRAVFDRQLAEAEQYGRHNCGHHRECNHG